MRPCLTKVTLTILFLAAPASAVWLEGVRWFRHDDFVRVVFDLSAPTAYRISERLADGYVDVILQGDLSRRIAEEIAIGESGVIAARQLRKTSTSLTWRIQVEQMARIRHMSVDEQPYKVALDFYPGGPAQPRAAPPSAKPMKPSAAAPDAGSSHGAAVAGSPKGKQAAAVASPPAPKPAKVSVPQGKGDPSAPDQRYEGLKPDERRRLLVGELLLQLGDSTGAMAYLEQVATQQPGHGWNRFLLAQAYLSKGDEFRARTLLEPLQAQERWAALLKPLMGRMQPPDAHGVVPGGDMPEEDLSYYLALLKQGGGLSAADLYARQDSAPAAFTWGALLPGIGIGSLLGLAAFAVAEMRRRRQMDQMVRDRIMSAPSSASPTTIVGFGEHESEYVEVSRRVREELEQVMHHERSSQPTEQADTFDASMFASADDRVDEDSLEGRVYRLADQKKSIVEIAEELNLGVDEVRLHLEMREQAGRISNA